MSVDGTSWTSSDLRFPAAVRRVAEINEVVQAASVYEYTA